MSPNSENKKTGVLFRNFKTEKLIYRADIT